MTNPLIGSIHALKREPKTDEALRLLQRIAALVRPIMQKRGWKVTKLREFYPRNASLLGLNVNRGLEVRIRLRPAHDNSQFLRYEDLLGTMLHELVHIVRSPHDAEFYRMLDELKAEAEVLLAQGYTGDGFFSDGRKLGAGIAHNVPLHMQREKTLQSIEARKRLQKLGLGGPPRKLGGGSDLVGMQLAATARQQRYTPAQMAAMAAERRWRDEKWCGEAMAGIVEESQPHGDDDGDEVVVVVGTSTPPDRPSSNQGDGNPVIVVSDSDSDTEPATTTGCACVVVEDC
ncbi:hypothetical protein LPJ81_000665 [Coemansia sp. IMI 209127]|nr:hypothetical protein LPJ81_000665 [Coemansia sp. IMI 209127]